MKSLRLGFIASVYWFFMFLFCPAADQRLVHLGSIDLYTSNSMAVLPRGDPDCLQLDGNRLYLQYMVNTMNPNVRSGYMVGSRTMWFGTRVFDISNPTSPTTIGDLPIKYRFKVRGERMLAQTAVKPGISELSYFDVSNPSTPKLLGRLPVRSTSFALAGERAYVLTRVSPPNNFLRLEIWNLSNPTSPTLIGALDKVPSRGPVVMGDYVILSEAGYRSEQDYIEIVDVADPAHPKLAARLDGPSAVDMHLNGSLLFSGGPRFGSISIVDLRNPKKPLKLGHINSTTANGGYIFRVSGSLLYACSPPVGIEIWDLSNPSQPILTDTDKQLPGIQGIDIVGNLIAVFQDSGMRTSVHLFRCSMPE